MVISSGMTFVSIHDIHSGAIQLQKLFLPEVKWSLDYTLFDSRWAFPDVCGLLLFIAS